MSYINGQCDVILKADDRATIESYGHRTGCEIDGKQPQRANLLELSPSIIQPRYCRFLELTENTVGVTSSEGGEEIHNQSPHA